MCKIVAPAKLFQLGVLIQSGGVQHHMNHVRHTVYHFVHHKQGYNILIVGGNRLCLWGATMEKVQKCETLKPFCESLYLRKPNHCSKSEEEKEEGQEGQRTKRRTQKKTTDRTCFYLWMWRHVIFAPH